VSRRCSTRDTSWQNLILRPNEAHYEPNRLLTSTLISSSSSIYLTVNETMIVTLNCAVKHCKYINIIYSNQKTHLAMPHRSSDPCLTLRSDYPFQSSYRSWSAPYPFPYVLILNGRFRNISPPTARLPNLPKSRPLCFKFRERSLERRSTSLTTILSTDHHISSSSSSP
jgi:hypothetical protein